jgi:hypothetical protein
MKKLIRSAGIFFLEQPDTSRGQGSCQSLTETPKATDKKQTDNILELENADDEFGPLNLCDRYGCVFVLFCSLVVARS